MCSIYFCGFLVGFVEVRTGCELVCIVVFVALVLVLVVFPNRGFFLNGDRFRNVDWDCFLDIDRVWFGDGDWDFDGVGDFDGDFYGVRDGFFDRERYWFLNRDGVRSRDVHWVWFVDGDFDGNGNGDWDFSFDVDWVGFWVWDADCFRDCDLFVDLSAQVEWGWVCFEMVVVLVEIVMEVLCWCDWFPSGLVAVRDVTLLVGFFLLLRKTCGQS